MNKYKLINKQTAEEHLCERVVIDGWDYYVTNKEYFKHNDLNVPSDFSKVSDITITNIPDLDIVNDSRNGYNKVIATNNPKIDIPKVVNEVEKLAFDCYEQVKKEYYSIGQKAKLPKSSKEFQAMGDGFIEGYNKSQETHPNSDGDMVDFAEFVAKYPDKNKNYKGEMLHAQSKYDGAERTIDLLQLWKFQRTKTLYYE